MGKSGFAFIKTRMFGFLKQHGPPEDISQRRYIIGLVMIRVSIIFGWISIYVSDLMPAYTSNPLPYAIAGDLLLLMSLIILGGNFRDKIRGQLSTLRRCILEKKIPRECVCVFQWLVSSPLGSSI